MYRCRSKSLTMIESSHILGMCFFEPVVHLEGRAEAREEGSTQRLWYELRVRDEGATAYWSQPHYAASLPQMSSSHLVHICTLSSVSANSYKIQPMNALHTSYATMTCCCASLAPHSTQETQAIYRKRHIVPDVPKLRQRA